MPTAKPEIKKGKKLSGVWIIPITAVVLGVWMVVYTYMTEGPEIRITFETAVGLEEGKTKVKFRNVEMGQVQEVTLSEDMQGVTAVVKMDRSALPLLREDTAFWVVTASIGGGGISGLDTILSGAYIAIAPGESSSKSLDFVGLEEPPLTPVGAPGLRLTLLSERSSSVSAGDPVLYHGFQVGRVESLEFDPESQEIRNTIFIDAPNHSLITSSTRFWDVSGISLKASAAGFEVSTGSLDTILRGGVTFSDIDELGPGASVENNTEFRLYPNFDDILKSPHKFRSYYVVGFSQSIKGLLPGAPVEYRGIKIGQVARIMVKELVNKGIREYKEPRGVPIPVLIYIEPARFEMPDTEESVEFMRQTFVKGVENGMRATIGTGNLLTGAQVVDLEYYEDVPPAEMGEFEGHPTIPTIVTGLSGIEAKISALLDKANKLPLEDTIGSVNLAVAELNKSLKALSLMMEGENVRTIPKELNSTLKALRTLLESEDTNNIPSELNASLEALRTLLEDEGIQKIPGELSGTLAAARFQLQGESAEVYQLGRTLKEVESAARALREFLEFLEKKPESLLRGKTSIDN